MVFVAQEYQATTVSFTSQSIASARGSQWHCTSIWDCFLWIDRSVSVTIGVHLPCIDRLLQGTIGRELLLQNYYNNVSVMSERRVVNSLVPRPPPSFPSLAVR